ncbi:MAG TPA: CHAT domain-containing protein [Kofleriaceae bacterium]|jgi:tetratricopeptide (TPR) repeat protein|nr:CHAT domain-containing protein [Kofleriaceae bacterium]
MTAHGRVSAYLDGTLRADEEAAVLDHVAGCAECQAELHAEVQLRDREDGLRGAEQPAEHALHGGAGDYLDGTLDGEAEDAFLDHVATCTRCQRDLHAEIQLRDREDALRESGAAARRARAEEVPAAAPSGRDDARGDVTTPSSPSAPTTSGSRSSGPAPRPRRHRPVFWVGAGFGITAAAALALLVVRPRPSATSEPVALALAPARGIEIRLSHALAARHRPYDTLRSSANLGEPIPPTVIAQLDVAGDCQGVATAYVLAGELVRADERYRRCPAGTEVDADRAGLAVLRGQLDLAIELTARVLDVAPDHTVALWNRALALHGLGLDLSAGAAFERVVALERSRDPGWAREAGERAAAMHDIERMRTAFNDVVQRGFEMVQGGPPLAPALARQVPARSRVMLHDALHTATTRARLDELAPLAAALEGRAGSNLGRYIAQARAQLSPERAAASAGYQEIVRRRGAIDDRTWTSWLALATRAKADDLILGGRIVTERLDGNPSAERLAAATGDPWFERAVDLLRAHQAQAAGRIDDYAARLAAIQAHCPAGEPSYRCLQLDVDLARLALERHQPTDALRHALTALAMSRQLGEWPQRSQALTLAGDAERFGNAFALAGAYYEESGRALDACGVHNAAYATAEMLFRNHLLARARALVATAPECDRVPEALELTLLVRLLRTGHAVLDRGSLVAEIAQARAVPALAGYAVYFDYLAAWVALDDEPTARERMARVVEAARRVEGSLRDKTTIAVDSALFADAGRRAQWADAVAVVARALGVTVPARCALAFGADDFRFAAVAVGPDGTLTGRYERDLAEPIEWLAPPAIRLQLAGCDEVAVLALPPWLGIGPVLDVQTPWHYVLGPARAPVAGRRRQVVIAEPVPPASAGLAPLAPRVWPSSDGPDELITGPAATPERVLAAISDATLVEIHSHATWLDRLDAPVLALSPGRDGWALGAATIRAAKLTGAPVVVLADCGGGAAARYEHEAWGLPLAFRAAGARAVIASLAEIPDRDAAVFFDAVTAEVARGATPAAAVARIRAEKIGADPASWMRHVVVFY